MALRTIWLRNLLAESLLGETLPFMAHSPNLVRARGSAARAAVSLFTSGRLSTSILIQPGDESRPSKDALWRLMLRRGNVRWEWIGGRRHLRIEQPLAQPQSLRTAERGWR